MPQPAVPVAAWPRRIVAAHAFGFAIWTLCCHLTVIRRGTGENLFRTAGIAGVLVALGAVALAWLRVCARVDLDVSGELPSPTEPEPTLAVRLGAAIGVVAILATWLLGRNPFWVWLGALLLLGTAVAWELWRSRGVEWTTTPTLTPSRTQGALLAAASVASGYLATCVGRSNTDDAYYVNIAVALADQPDLPLYLRDTIHSAGVVMIPAYRVHAYELLAGALSRLSGVEAVWFMHIGLPALTGALLPLAWATLLRELDPRRWLAMVGVVLAWFVLDGSDSLSPSMHGYARLFQGKAVMYAVGVPALAALGLRFGRRSAWTGLVLLLLGQVGMVGLSSTGLWLGPAVAVTAVFATIRWDMRFVRAALLALASSAYALAMGLWVKAQVAAQSGDGASPAFVSGSIGGADDGVIRRLGGVFYVALAGWPLAFLYSAVLLAALVVARTSLARRYLVAFLFVFVLFFGNPYLADVVQRAVVGRSTYSRILWLLPIGAALGVFFTASLSGSPTTRARRVAGAGSLALCVAFFALAPKATLFERSLVGWTPSLKVDRYAMEAAYAVTEAMPKRGYVLAAAQVSMFLPMVHRHPYPVIVKPKWFPSGMDGPQRFRLRRMVDRESRPLDRKRRERFGKQLDHYRVSGVVLKHAAVKTVGMEDALRSFGFVRRARLTYYDVWTRAPR